MTSFWKTPAAALACGSLILTLAMGVRHGFGLFLPPMSMELGWGRETFAFALALQNLVWGFTQPVIGMLADRWGGGRVVVAGVVLYCAGLYGMASSTSPMASMRRLSLVVRLPSPRPVVPASPVRVTILERRLPLRSLSC